MAEVLCSRSVNPARAQGGTGLSQPPPSASLGFSRVSFSSLVALWFTESLTPGSWKGCCGGLWNCSLCFLLREKKREKAEVGCNSVHRNRAKKKKVCL